MIQSALLCGAIHCDWFAQHFTKYMYFDIPQNTNIKPPYVCL